MKCVLTKCVAIIFISCLCFAGNSRSEEKKETPPEAAIEPAEFTIKIDEQTKKEIVDFEWRRPPEVTYVLLFGCGGGSSGYQADQDGGGYAGGAAAPVLTLLVPVSADIYKIKIGGGAACLPRWRPVTGLLLLHCGEALALAGVAGVAS